jgi:hypothetical protein
LRRNLNLIDSSVKRIITYWTTGSAVFDRTMEEINSLVGKKPDYFPGYVVTNIIQFQIIKVDFGSMYIWLLLEMKKEDK